MRRDNRVNEPDQVLSDALQPDALHARLGTLEQEIELVRRETGLRKAGFTTQLHDAPVFAASMLVDDASRGVIGVR